MFTNQERKDGALTLHFIMVIYMFVSLAVVCDVYFVSSLEKICEVSERLTGQPGAETKASGTSQRVKLPQ